MDIRRRRIGFLGSSALLGGVLLLTAGSAIGSASAQSAAGRGQAAPAQAQTARPPANAPYRNAALPIAQRVEDLLARMTLEEKVAQLLSVWDNKADIQTPEFEFDPVRAAARYPHGVGQIVRPGDFKGPNRPENGPRWRDAASTMRYVNSAQRWAVERTRLGIPLLFHEEALHGVALRGTTSFPQAIGLASTFDPDLVREINRVIAREARARGAQLVLSPVVDIARDPRWGRIEETFGEDPYLAGEMGVASVEGLQGPRTADRRIPQDRVLATLKHMTGHGQPENGTNVGPAPLAERTLREMFFPPFETVIHRTDVGAVMPSYNEIDGVPSHANSWLLNGVLRGEWNFSGVVVSDYYAIAEMISRHRVVSDAPEAARVALASGVDIDLPTGVNFETLGTQVASGAVPMAQIDRAVRAVLTAKFRAGLFERPYADPRLERLVNNAEAVALARRAAERSLVLLKNDGVLPLNLEPRDGQARRIAVIGPNAAIARLGGYTGEPRNTVTPLEGLRAAVGNRATIRYAEGARIAEGGDWWDDNVRITPTAENLPRIAEAVALAQDSDVVVLFVGDTEQTSREAWAEAHLGDRASLNLVGDQLRLFEALRATGKPVVAVLVNGRPPSYPELVEGSSAVLETWYAGEQQGHAIADALLGRINPGGRLPVSVARHVGQLPIFYNYKPTARRGYLFEGTQPLFPFGYGLSYTSFTLSAPRLSAARIRAGESVDVSVDVTNTGARAGDEVVQLYVRDMVASVTRPVQELRGFRRITLAPGERRTVTMRLGPDAMRMFNARMQRVIEPGDFSIMTGPNSAQTQSVTLTVTQ